MDDIAQTVGDLIEVLNQYPKDMPISADYDPHRKIEVSIKTWQHNNYPYDLPDVEYVCVE